MATNREFGAVPGDIAPFDFNQFNEHEGVHFFSDERLGLHSIIAVHSTKLGPAVGGARYWQYANTAAAVTDVLRLSRAMSLKNAMAGLPLGGGKSVILGRPGTEKSADLMAAYGRAIDSLNGRYVAAEDVGMSMDEMVQVSRHTRFVAGLPVVGAGAGGDPSPFTAAGVHVGIKAAAKRALGADSMKDVRVAIQGTGNVGGALARLLAADGARLILADVNMASAEKLAAELGGAVVPADRILAVETDVLSPCALGATLNEHSIPKIRASIIAGAANNQLATPADGDRIHERAILYAPDYVINAGGIINVAMEYLGEGDEAQVRARIDQIPPRLETIWSESDATGRNAADVADEMARRLIGRD
jgi:leucine dehydrogenase